MCGFVGFVDYTKKTDINTLKKMTDVLYHRGPDDSGYSFYSFIDYNIGFGHRRLSILDLSSHGHQPMKFEHLEIIYNGEVYNFKEIRQQLEKEGYSFFSDSDTEVILKSFHRWGIGCLEKFRGMFAFVIYDYDKKLIYLIRDRVGVKPFYYYWNNNILMFGSEIRAFYPNVLFNKKINYNALSNYLQFGYISSPLSIYENTHKLEPAHYLVFNIEKKVFIKKQYWNIENFLVNKTDLTYGESKKYLHSILVDSFLLRTISDVPIGTFLSGGIDSSLVTAIVQKNTSIPLKTFTIGFYEDKYNEAPYAKKIAEYLKTEHYEYYCSINEAKDIVHLLPEIYDEPFGDSSAIPTYLVSKIARENVKVILSGDGGDEIFAGYTSYGLFEKRLNVLKKLKIFKSIINYIPLLFNEKINNKILKTKNILKYDDVSNMFNISNSVFTQSEINIIINYYSYLEKHSLKISEIENMMYSDFIHYLADDILVKVDRASMSVSLESREPLLDNKIIEFASSLPIEYKRNKRILKDILSEYIPQNLFERKKTGFGIPINKWLREDLYYLLDEHFDKKFITKQGIFDNKVIHLLLKKFKVGKLNDRKIWTLLMFQMWYKQNIGD